MLSNNQIDAMTELINISIGYAANSLSEIVDTQVLLQVPDLKVLASEDMKTLRLIFGDNKYATVRQEFQGNLSGTTALAFPPESAQNLISLLTDTEVGEDELDILQTGTLLDVGNIINNAFLRTLNNQFEFHVSYKLPHYSDMDISHLIDSTFGEEKDLSSVSVNRDIRF